jgi:hypothetical protein
MLYRHGAARLQHLELAKQLHTARKDHLVSTRVFTSTHMIAYAGSRPADLWKMQLLGNTQLIVDREAMMFTCAQTTPFMRRCLYSSAEVQTLRLLHLQAAAAAMAGDHGAREVSHDMFNAGVAIAVAQL